MRLVNKAEAIFAILRHDEKILELQTPDTSKSFSLEESDKDLLASIFDNPDKVASVSRFQEVLAKSKQKNLTDSEVQKSIEALMQKLASYHKALRNFLVPIASGYMLHHNWESVKNPRTKIPEIFHKNLNNAVQTIARQVGMVHSICKHTLTTEDNEAYILDIGKYQRDLDFILKTYDVVISLILEETHLEPKTKAFKTIAKQLNDIRTHLNLSAVESSDLENGEWPDNYINRCYKAVHKLAGQLKDF